MEDKKQDDEKEKKVPKIRFKGFTGEWEQKRIGDIAEKTYGGGTPKTNVPEYWNGEIPWIQSSNLSEHNLFDVDIQKHITNIGLQESAAQLVSENSIAVVSHVGVGKLAFMPIKYTTSQDFISLSELNTDPVFTCYSLYKKIQNDLHIVQGSTIKGITKDDLLNKVIMIPEMLEQKEIGVTLQSLDNLITLEQRKCDELKAVKKYMLQKMFPKNGETKPEIRFAGFTDDWEQRKVSDIFKITRGYVLAMTETTVAKDDNNCYPVYSSQTKNEGLMGFYSDFLYENAITWTTDGANAGTVRYRSGKFYCTNVCGVLLSEEGYANKAVSEALNAVAWKYVSHVGNPKLMNNVMADIEIVIPKSIKEQEVISKFFDEIDNLITFHHHKCEELKELKKYMLQNMFPGMS